MPAKEPFQISFTYNKPKRQMRLLLTTLLILCITSLSIAQQAKIIAHRGAWKNTNAPQNSIAALQEAIKGKYWGTEFDVCLTKDNILIVNHDNDYQGVDISTSTYQELNHLRLKNGEKLPTAEEYMLEGIKQKKTKMVYEIKPSKAGIEKTLKATELSYQLVKDLKALDQTVFISFSYDACLLLRKLDKKVKIQFLGSNKTPQDLFNDKIYGLDFNYNVFKNNTNYIQEAKNLKMDVNVWTVNSKEMLQYFIDQKVDFITTDEPELLKQMLK